MWFTFVAASYNLIFLIIIPTCAANIWRRSSSSIPNTKERGEPIKKDEFAEVDEEEEEIDLIEFVEFLLLLLLSFLLLLLLFEIEFDWSGDKNLIAQRTAIISPSSGLLTGTQIIESAFNPNNCWFKFKSNIEEDIEDSILLLFWFGIGGYLYYNT